MSSLRHHAALMRSLDDTESRLQWISENPPPPDRDEMAHQMIEDYAKDRAALEVHRRLLLSALTKIELGRYGICEDCRGSISLKRLDAMPWATLCLACKTAEEIRAEQFRQATERAPKPTPADEEGVA